MYINIKGYLLDVRVNSYCCLGIFKKTIETGYAISLSK